MLVDYIVPIISLIIFCLGLINIGSLYGIIIPIITTDNIGYILGGSFLFFMFSSFYTTWSRDVDTLCKRK